MCQQQGLRRANAQNPRELPMLLSLSKHVMKARGRKSGHENSSFSLCSPSSSLYTLPLVGHQETKHPTCLRRTIEKGFSVARSGLKSVVPDYEICCLQNRKSQTMCILHTNKAFLLSISPGLSTSASLHSILFALWMSDTENKHFE